MEPACQTTRRPPRGGELQGTNHALASAAPRPPTEGERKLWTGRSDCVEYAAELAVLPLELLHPGPLLGRQPRPLAAVDLGLVDPLAQGLGADPELAGDPGHRAEP